MKRYIKPVVMYYELNEEEILAGSIGLSDEAADGNYTGGGDARRRKARYDEVYEEEETNEEW